MTPVEPARTIIYIAVAIIVLAVVLSLLKHAGLI